MWGARLAQGASSKYVCSHQDSISGSVAPVAQGTAEPHLVYASKHSELLLFSIYMATSHALQTLCQTRTALQDHGHSHARSAVRSAGSDCIAKSLEHPAPAQCRSLRALETAWPCAMRTSRRCRSS